MRCLKVLATFGLLLLVVACGRADDEVANPDERQTPTVPAGSLEPSEPAPTAESVATAEPAPAAELTALPRPTITADLGRGWLGSPLTGHEFELASNGSRAVLLGWSEDPIEPIALWSEDGYTWVAASNTRNYGHRGSVAGGSGGFVAVSAGTTGGGLSKPLPVVIHSSDGASWEEIDASAVPSVPIDAGDPPEAGVWYDSVAGGTEGFVIVGSIYHVDAETSDRFAWFSTDGRSWVETDLPPISAPLTVAANQSAWMAVAFEPDAPSMPTIFVSANGVNWTPTDTQTAPSASPTSAPGGPIAASLLAGDDNDNWVLAHRTGVGPPVLWQSTDGGQNWSERVVEDASASSSEYWLHSAIETTRDGFVVVGAYRGDSDQFALFSRDGREWQLSRPPFPVVDLTPIDGGLLGVVQNGAVVIRPDTQSPP